MSFQFDIETNAQPCLRDIIAGIGLEKVAYLSAQNDFSDVTPLLGDVVLYQPDQSVRGVWLKKTEKGYGIRLNTFTPVSDARLAVATAKAVALLAHCAVRPEGCEEAIATDALTAFCGEEWERARFSEAKLVIDICLGSIGDKKSSHNEITIHGYRRAFVFSRPMTDSLIQKGLSKDEIIENYFHQARELQEIDQKENIHAAMIFVATLKQENEKTKPDIWAFLKKIAGIDTRKNIPEPPKKSYNFFVLSPNLRTLSPAADYVLFTIERDGQRSVRQLSFDRFAAFAEEKGYRRFGAKAYDIPAISLEQYLQLFEQSEPML